MDGVCGGFGEGELIVHIKVVFKYLRAEALDYRNLWNAALKSLLHPMAASPNIFIREVD
jgi:hypothetical protein